MSLLPLLFARLSAAADPASARVAGAPVGAGRFAYAPDRRVRVGPLLVAVGVPALMMAGFATWKLDTRVVTLTPLEGTLIRVDPIVPPPPEPVIREKAASPEQVLTAPRRPFAPPIADAPLVNGGDDPVADPPYAGEGLDGAGSGTAPAMDPPLPPEPVLVKATRDPRFAAGFQPDYPARELRDGTEGTVTVRVLIGTDGRVDAVELVRTDSPGFFTATERHARARWRFRPATRDGVPVAEWQTMTVRFTISAD